MVTEIDWDAPPNFCPRCGSGKHLRYGVEEMGEEEDRVLEPQSGHTLKEHQCDAPSCEGASFWM